MIGRALVVSFLFGLPLPMLAAEVEFRAGATVLVAADEVIDGDLYATGETVTIAGVVRGDVVAAGGQIRLTGLAEGDFIAAGQAVFLEGTVGDDVRAAGMVLQLGPEATVTDHVVSAGYSFEAEPGSRIGGELVVQAAKAKLAGDVASRARITGGAIEIDGNVVGDLEVEVEGDLDEASWFERFVPAPVSVPSVTRGLKVTDAARIGGRLSYSSPEEVSISDGVASEGVEWSSGAGGADADIAEEDQPPTLLSRVGGVLQRFGALLIVGFLLLWRAPAWIGGRSSQLATNPLRSFVWGIVGMVGVPVAGLLVLGVSILLAILAGRLSLDRLALGFVLLGITLLVVILVGYILAILFGAPLLVAAAGGRGLVERAHSAWWRPYLALLVGLAILTALTNLPVVGGGLALLAIIAGLGPLVQWLMTQRWNPISSGGALKEAWRPAPGKSG